MQYSLLAHLVNIWGHLGHIEVLFGHSMFSDVTEMMTFNILANERPDKGRAKINFSIRLIRSHIASASALIASRL